MSTATNCKGSPGPVLRDCEGALVGGCARAQGGTKTVGAPAYVLQVTNPPDEG